MSEPSPAQNTSLVKKKRTQSRVLRKKMHFPYPCRSKLFLSCPVPQSYCMVFIVFNRCEIRTLTFLESKCIKLEKQRKKQISKTYFEQKTRYTIKCSRSGQGTNVKTDRVKSQTIFYKSRIGHQSASLLKQ